MVLELGLNLDRVQENVRKAEVEDLLDRATVYRNGMEPEALELIDAELRARGVDAAAVAAHRERRAATVYGADGLAVKCGRCFRPAVAQRWGWHQLWGVLPVFPRRLAFCDEHLPTAWREFPTLPGDWENLAPSQVPEEGIMKKSQDVKRSPSE